MSPSGFSVIDTNGQLKVVPGTGTRNIPTSSGDLTDHANIPLLNADNHYTGTGNTVFDGNVKPATSQQFSWQAKAMDTVYQAPSDGLAICIINAGAGLTAYTIGKSDAANPPTTVRGGANAQSTALTYGTATMPVRKGDFWTFETHNTSGVSAYIVYWVPLGTAG